MMDGFVGSNTVISNVEGDSSSKIYNNCRVYNTKLMKMASIGDYSTVRVSTLGERSSIQRYGDIWGLELGAYSCIGRMSTVQETVVGKFCALADYMTIGCDNHDYKMITTHPFWHDTSWGIMDDMNFSDEYRKYEYKDPCIIGNDVWIGAGVNICRNVNIGNGCVIGAGAVITKDIEPYSVVVGVPGRVLKKRFNDSVIEKLEKIRWWDLPVAIIKDNISLFRDDKLTLDNLGRLEELCLRHNSSNINNC